MIKGPMNIEGICQSTHQVTIQFSVYILTFLFDETFK